MKDIFNCGCGGDKKVDDEEIERVIREAEKEREKVLVPVEQPIPVKREDVFAPSRVTPTRYVPVK